MRTDRNDLTLIEIRQAVRANNVNVIYSATVWTNRKLTDIGGIFIFYLHATLNILYWILFKCKAIILLRSEWVIWTKWLHNTAVNNLET